MNPPPFEFGDLHDQVGQAGNWIRWERVTMHLGTEPWRMRKLESLGCREGKGLAALQHQLDLGESPGVQSQHGSVALRP